MKNTKINQHNQELTWYWQADGGHVTIYDGAAHALIESASVAALCTRTRTFVQLNHLVGMKQ